MDNLEETTPRVEEVKPEEVKPTESKKEPTVSIIDTPEFKKALDKGVGKGVASIQSQLSVSKATEESTKADLEVSNSLLGDYKKVVTELENEKFADNPEALEGYKNTRRMDLRDKEQNARQKKQDLTAVEQEGYRMLVILNDKSNELLKQYQVPKKILELCTSEKQMEDIAKDYPEAGEKKEDKKEAPKFAGAGDDKGINLKDMSPDDTLKYGFRQLNK